MTTAIEASIKRSIVIAARARGFSLSEIGRFLGVSRQRVEQLLNDKAHRARRCLKEALERGLVTRASHCERCGHERKALEAHHEDYDEPYLVLWLCIPCHNEVHPHYPEIRAVSDGQKEAPSA